MKFNDHFTFLHFKKVAAKSIINEEFKARLEICDKLYIPDEVYFLLDDSLATYMNEVCYHSKQKKFYKDLFVEKLNTSHLPNLSSLLTHLMLGYTMRISLRNNVDPSYLLILKDEIFEMINSILSKGEVDNKLYKVLK